jgi:iron complex outermembrane recepter protein
MKPSLMKLMAVLLVLLIGVTIANGQTKQVLTWRDSLDIIQKLPAGEAEEQRDSVARIRTGIEFWLRLHPNTAIKLESAPPQPWNSEQILKQAKLLRETVDAIIKEDHGQSFDLGVTEISVSAEASPISPITDSIDRNEISALHATNVAEAALNLPGLSIDYKANRNQTGIMIRGFDTRQVGIYLDGIPIYVPYDGYADIARFLSSDISVIEVAKGYSSPLLGPNGLGGTINVVTRQPEKKIEGDVSFGTGSGRKLESGAHLGSRWEKFFVRGGMDWLETDYFPLSGKFTSNPVLAPNQLTYQRVDSDKRDIRYNGRFGWAPKGEDQYVFSYNKQKGENDVPPYSGVAPATNKVNYWDYAYWNRDSYYFNSNTSLGESSSIKVRAFYDKYPNALTVFTDPDHTAMTQFSPYDDYSAGFSTEYSTRAISRNALGASFFFKDDSHKEHKINYKNGLVSLNTPWVLDRDRYVSIGLQDVLNIASKVRATVGLSIDHLSGVTAQDTDSKTNTPTYFTCSAGTSAGPCLLMDKWVFNPLASISYSIANTGTIFFSFAEKTHFPTLKDRYSYKNGQAIPNPTLKPEYARNYTLGYSHAFAGNTMMQVELFRSDVRDAIENANILPSVSYVCQTLGKTYCQQSTNVGDEIHKGVEFTVRSSPVRRLSLVSNYTYLLRSISNPATSYAFTAKNGTVTTVPFVPSVFPTGSPKHKTITTANWQLPYEITMMATFRYEAGAFTVDQANTFYKVPGFASVDWGMTFPISHVANLQTGVKNLLDRNYYYQEGFPEPGRNWYMNLRFRF